jgi:hypothetical protein
MRQYHVISKAGVPAVGPLTAAQVLSMFDSTSSTDQMLVWWKEQKEWINIKTCIAEIRHEAKLVSTPRVLPTSAKQVNISIRIPSGQVRITRNGVIVGVYPEEDIAALLRAKVVLYNDSYQAAGMNEPAPVSQLLLNMVITPSTAASIPSVSATKVTSPIPAPTASPIRRQPGRGEIVCPNLNCGYVGRGDKIARGSTIVGILLLLCWILPGIIYFMFFSGYRTCCPRCQCQINNDN